MRARDSEFTAFSRGIPCCQIQFPCYIDWNSLFALAGNLAVESRQCSRFLRLNGSSRRLEFDLPCIFPDEQGIWAASQGETAPVARLLREHRSDPTAACTIPSCKLNRCLCMILGTSSKPPPKLAMSIVSYHARIDERLLETLQANPDLFWELPEHSDSAGAQLLYLDKDWSALSWLLSSKAREEQKHDLSLMRGQNSGENFAGPDARGNAKTQAAAKLGFQLVDTESMPDDPALIAIQGRGPRDSRFQQIGFGARTFIPHEVAGLSASLDRITDADLREHFDPVVMEALDVEGIRWTEEEESDVLEKILIPCFERLRAFYNLAALAGQHVLVVIS